MEAEAFLKLALRARRDPSARATLPGLFPGLDWPAVITLANTERVTPLLYQVVKDLPVPPEILERLRTVYYESARTNILRFQKLEQILAALAAHNIPVILLKGAALADTVYSNLALRPMTDLDMLVPIDRLDEAVEAVNAIGFTRTVPEAKSDMLMLEACVEQLSIQDIPDTFLEIHWDVLHPPYFQGRLETQWLWETASQVTVGHQKAFLLSPEAQLLHLCAHLCLHHHGQGLLWQNDIADLLSKFKALFKWELLFEKACQYQLISAVQIALPIAVNEFSAPVPDGVLTRLAALIPSEREKKTFSKIMATDQSPAQLTFHFMMDLPGWRPKLRYTLTRLFPAPNYMRERYGIPHPLLTPLYYPYRWITGLLRRQ